MRIQKYKQAGFSMIELLVVILLLSIIMGAVFSQVNNIQIRSRSEDTKLDMFQQAREFMDGIRLDLRAVGYPNIHNFAPGVISTSAPLNDQHNAVGLVKVAVDELRFEGDVNQDGTPDEIIYHVDTSGTNCPCLRRSQITKITGNPLTGQSAASLQTEVTNVQTGTTTAPLFYAYDASGNAVTLPVDINSNANTIANIKTIETVMTVQSPSIDLQTHQPAVVTLRSVVRIPNCSQAASGQPMSCQ